MSRKNNAITTTQHASGQKFYEKEGMVIGTPIAFEQGKRTTISYNPATLGAPTEVESTTRAQLKVRGEVGSTRLDSATLEQLGIATGKELTREDLKLLKGALVTYYVSDRKEGEEFYYTPDDINPRIAPRTGEFTSIFAIEPAERFEEAFENLPDRMHTVEQTEEEAKALLERARELKALRENGVTKEPIDEPKTEQPADKPKTTAKGK